MKKALSLILALMLCLSLCACGGGERTNTNNSNTKTANNATQLQETTVPNNGEWDDILCSGDGYHLVVKMIDTYSEYNMMIGVIDQSGNWVHELTEKGAFVEGVRFRALGSSKTLSDSSCYMYLGEGVFLASPGVSVFTKDEEYRVGPWQNSLSSSPTGRVDVSIWECLIWNVEDNIQKEFHASKLSVFNDGYLLFCADQDAWGDGVLSSMNTKGEIQELPCKYLSNKPAHEFPVYSEGLFYACSEERSKPGFYDIKGNLKIDLSEYDVARIWYSDSQGVNAPYFENGQAVILFQNAGGNVFKAVIDKTGAFVGEPQKMEGILTY